MFLYFLPTPRIRFYLTLEKYQSPSQPFFVSSPNAPPQVGTILSSGRSHVHFSH